MKFIAVRQSMMPKCRDGSIATLGPRPARRRASNALTIPRYDGMLGSRTALIGLEVIEGPAHHRSVGTLRPDDNVHSFSFSCVLCTGAQRVSRIVRCTATTRSYYDPSHFAGPRLVPVCASFNYNIGPVFRVTFFCGLSPGSNDGAGEHRVLYFITERCSWQHCQDSTEESKQPAHFNSPNRKRSCSRSLSSNLDTYSKHLAHFRENGRKRLPFARLLMVIKLTIGGYHSIAKIYGARIRVWCWTCSFASRPR